MINNTSQSLNLEMSFLFGWKAMPLYVDEKTEICSGLRALSAMQKS